LHDKHPLGKFTFEIPIEGAEYKEVNISLPPCDVKITWYVNNTELKMSTQK
jgi:hypothetical protein